MKNGLSQEYGMVVDMVLGTLNQKKNSISILREWFERLDI